MRRGIKLALALAAIALMAWLAWRAVTWTLRFARNAGDMGPDPMFAQETPFAAPTVPPGLDGETGESDFRDNSANWDTSVRTPVDKTAGQLGEEARAAAEN